MNCNIETQVVFCCLCCRKIQRLCKARAEAKFTWIMPSRRQRCIYMKRLHTFPYTQFFPPKNPAYPSLTTYLLVYKCVASVWFASPTLH